MGSRQKWLDDSRRWSEMMALAHRGDRAAYTRLLSELGDVIKKYLRVRYGNAMWLEDMVQECLLAIHRGRHTYDARRPFRPWMFAIVRNRSIDFLRSEKASLRQQTATDPDTEAGLELDQIVPLDLARSISRLNPDHREALTLTKYIGLTIEEAATWSGISPAAMKTRVARAVQTLRKRLEREAMLYE